MKTCSVAGCEKEVHSKGYCKGHYERNRKYGDPLANKPKEAWVKDAPFVSRKGNPICSIEGCDNPVQARGWCSKHYKRWSEYGDPLADFTRTRDECLVEGCSDPAHAKGYCLVHYSRWKRTGDPEGLVEMPKGALEGTNYKKISVSRPDKLAPLFFEKILVDPKTHCWVWQGSFSGSSERGDGRPTIFLKGRNINAARLSYAVFKGRVPKGKLVCHSCDGGKFCVSPLHLYLGTYKDNLNDVEVSKYLQETGRLTAEDARMVKICLIDKVPSDKIINHFGISRQVLSKIRTKLSWAHVKI